MFRSSPCPYPRARELSHSRQRECQILLPSFQIFGHDLNRTTNSTQTTGPAIDQPPLLVNSFTSRHHEWQALEERKEFIRAFVEGVTVHPDALHLEVQTRKIPALGPGFPSVELVAGARYEPEKMILEPRDRFVAMRRAA
jgi:hypothetical protein